MRLQGLLGRIAGDQVVFTLTTPPAGTYVRLRQGDLAQVLVNLAVNARDAMPTGGRLTVDASIVSPPANADATDADAGRFVRLQVEDSGIGMTADVQGRECSSASSRPSRPRALVMDWQRCRRSCSSTGGTIELRSEPGHGARS